MLLGLQLAVCQGLHVLATLRRLPRAWIVATVEAVEQGLVLLDALLPFHDGAHFREHAHRRTVVAGLGQ